MKKILGLAIAGIGLFATKVCFAAATPIFNWTATDTTDLSAQILQTWTDFRIPILIMAGIAIGFVIILKGWGTVKRVLGRG